MRSRPTTVLVAIHIDYDTLLAQAHITVFDLRNRSETAAPASVPTNTLTLNAQLHAAPTEAETCYAIAFSLRESQWDFSVNGIAVSPL